MLQKYYSASNSQCGFSNKLSANDVTYNCPFSNYVAKDNNNNNTRITYS